MGNLQPLLRAIPFPVDKVLKTTSMAPDIQDMSYRESGVVVDDAGGWREVGWWSLETIEHRLYLKHMKGGVYWHGSRQLESNGGEFNDPRDGERTNEAGGPTSSGCPSG